MRNQEEFERFKQDCIDHWQYYFAGNMDIAVGNDNDGNTVWLPYGYDLCLYMEDMEEIDKAVREKLWGKGSN